MPRLIALNQVCECGHWHEEHKSAGECEAPNCYCRAFAYDYDETGWRLAEYLHAKYGLWLDRHPQEARHDYRHPLGGRNDG